jgi:hypothetical protein
MREISRTTKKYATMRTLKFEPDWTRRTRPMS